MRLMPPECRKLDEIDAPGFLEISFFAVEKAGARECEAFETGSKC